MLKKLPIHVSKKFVLVQHAIQLLAIKATSEMWPEGPRLKQALQPSIPVFPVHLERAVIFQNSIFHCVPDRSKWILRLPVLAV